MDGNGRQGGKDGAAGARGGGHGARRGSHVRGPVGESTLHAGPIERLRAASKTPSPFLSAAHATAGAPSTPAKAVTTCKIRSDAASLGEGAKGKSGRARGHRHEKTAGSEMTHLSKEPGDDIAKDDRLVRLVVVGRGGDPCEVPEISLPFVEARVLAAGVEEEDVGSALDEPAAVEDLHPGSAHTV